MTARTSVPSARLLQEPQDFSLVLGGPLFQLLRRAHLTDDTLRLVRQRIIVISLLAWLPLLILAALAGQALGGRAAVPFVLDVDVHVRFLVALPLLIVAELVVHQRMRFVVKQFRERQLIPESARARFDAAIASAVSAAELGARRGAAARARLWRRRPDRLAPVHGPRRRPRGTPPRAPGARRSRGPGCGTAT